MRPLQSPLQLQNTDRRSLPEHPVKEPPEISEKSHDSGTQGEGVISVRRCPEDAQISRKMTKSVSSPSLISLPSIHTFLPFLPSPTSTPPLTSPKEANPDQTPESEAPTTTPSTPLQQAFLNLERAISPLTSPQVSPRKKKFKSPFSSPLGSPRGHQSPPSSPPSSPRHSRKTQKTSGRSTTPLTEINDEDDATAVDALIDMDKASCQNTKEETTSTTNLSRVNRDSRKSEISRPPEPLLPECPAFGYFDLIDLDPLEVARQLTVCLFFKTKY